jgi:diguanylate cyclase (GGDEF)-like protein/PAS domain S-box-containing protein
MTYVAAPVATRSEAKAHTLARARDEALRESETLQRTLLENLPVGVIIVDPLTRAIESVNDAAAALFGAPQERIAGHRCHSFLCPASEGACPIWDLGGVVDGAEREMLCADGSRRPVLKSVKRIQIRGQEKLLECFVDITVRKQAEEALRHSEAKFRTLYDSTGDAVMLLDETGFFDCNKATLEIFGCATRDQLCSRHPADLSPPVQPCGTNSMALANQRIATAMENGSQHFEWAHKRADTGEVFSADVLLTAMELEGKQVIQAVVRDITERKRAEEERERLLSELQGEVQTRVRLAEELREKNRMLERMATTDSLTGLANRRALMARMADEVARCRRYGAPLAVAMIDLDDFKRVNDSYGHAVGDRVLSTVGQLIEGGIRSLDLVARFGGEEFTVLLPHLHLSQAAAAMDRVRQTVAAHPVAPQVTMSIGVAASPPGPADLDTLLSLADHALYAAKRAGRNRVELAGPV